MNAESKTVIKKLVLDVLKPHEPSIIEMATKIATLRGVDVVNIASLEMNRNTESVKISIEGSDVDLENVRKAIEELGGVIHSVDEVTSSKKSKA